MKNILKYYTRAFIFLFPLFFLPIVVDSMSVGKNWFLGAGAIVGLIIYVADLLISKKTEVKLNKAFWFMTALVAWSAVSWFRLSLGLRASSLLLPFGFGTVLSLWAWLFLWLQVTDKDEYEKQFSVLTVSGVIVALTSLAVFLMPGSKLPFVWPKNNPIVSISAPWSITGSLLSEAVLLLFLAAEWVKKLLGKLKTKGDFNAYWQEALAVGFLGLILILDIYKVFKLGLVILDGRSAWVIAVETLKTSPIFGVGIGNFLEAFNVFRPVSYNATKFWSTGFSGSSMGLLHIWTELGLVGLALVLWFVAAFLRQKKTMSFWTSALVVVLALVLPLNQIGLFLAVWLLASKAFETYENKLVLRVGENNTNVMPWILGAVVLTLAGCGAYHWGRMLGGEIYLRKSLLAASKNDGTATYNYQRTMLGFNPNVADYHKIYSQTNLSLAQVLLNEKDISDENKEKASTLVQQAVREGKAAVSLDPNNSIYWSNLAVIYKSLIGLVDGAADWSFQAYQQAAALDPINPMLKLDMGGLLYAANRFDEADRVFEQVVMAKKDFANGWYNWAYTAKQSNKLADAVQRMTQAVSLVAVDSGDYDKAAKELETWKKELDEAIKKQQQQQQQAQKAAEKKPETLKTPEPMPTMGAEEKVNVPASDLEPPMTEQTQETQQP